MPYLLDTDTFVRAKNDHCRFAVCPGYWEWLERASRDGRVFSVRAVLDELTRGNDELKDRAEARASLFLGTDPGAPNAMAEVSRWVSSRPHYTPQAVQRFFSGADYRLVAEARARAWVVVTHEQPSPLARIRVPIPDICTGLGVRWTSPFQMLEDEGAVFELRG